MRNLFVVTAATLALAACSQKAEEAPAADTAAAETTAAAAADAGTQAGTYEVKGPDGKVVGKTTINADGTYVDTDPAGKEMRGTFTRKDGKDCFDPEGDEGEECWTVTAPDASGAFKATSTDGKTTLTITPVAAVAAATPAAAAT